MNTSRTWTKRILNILFDDKPHPDDIEGQDSNTTLRPPNRIDEDEVEIIEEKKKMQVYETLETKGRGKPIKGQFKYEWTHRAYVPNLKTAFRILIDSVGLSSRSAMNRYLEELEDITKFIEANVTKSI